MRNWVAGQEEPEVVGVGARFGRIITDHEQEAHSFPLATLDPVDGCSNSTKAVGPRNLSMEGDFDCIVLNAIHIT